jgi:ribosomal-protein-alanine N-acetyltransferase
MIRVRSARSEDVPRLIEIASHALTAARWSREAYAKLFAQEDAPRRLSLVIEEDDRVMGFIVGCQVADVEWEIENVAVNAQARHRGLGSRLLGEFLDLVRSRRGNEIYLEVRESNRAARALYEKWAFIEAGRRKGYYASPAEDAVVLKFSFPND